MARFGDHQDRHHDRVHRAHVFSHCPLDGRRHFRNRGGVATFTPQAPLPGTPPLETTNQEILLTEDGEYTVRLVFGVGHHVVTGKPMSSDYTANAQMDTTVSAQIDTAAGYQCQYPGVAVDTDGDGMNDAVGVDTTGDGLADAFVDINMGGTDGEFKATVRMAGPTALQVAFPDRSRATISCVADAINTFLDDLVEREANAADRLTKTGLEIYETDYQIDEINIGGLGAVNAKKAVTMTMPAQHVAGDVSPPPPPEVLIDDWQVPGLDFGEALRVAGDQMHVKGHKQWIIGAKRLEAHAAVADDDVSGCLDGGSCAVM